MSDDSYFTDFFEQLRPRFVEFAKGLDVDEPGAAVDDAAANFAAMVPDMAYRDDRGHPMALSVFGCSAQLALYLAVSKRGIGVHDYGRAMLASMRRDMQSAPAREPADRERIREHWERFDAAADRSRDAAPGEFVFETVRSDDGSFDHGFNIKSCAICHAFAKYDAMELVPYMCATDDLTSDLGSQGLERTGTIAVGAHQCDFRFKRGRKAEPLAERYPDRIRIKQA